MIFPAIALAMLFVAGYGGYRYFDLAGKFERSETDLGAAREELARKTAEFEARIASLQNDLAVSQEESEGLSRSLTQEKSKNDAFESQIRGISSAVGTLEKLSTLDKELLEKYSKVYFLNEHYVPREIAQVPPSYGAIAGKDMYAHARVVPYLSRMIEASRAASSSLAVVSAYRSFDEQTAVKTGYRVIYGSGANQFSADQGYSEHQLGTAVDIVATRTGPTLSVSFENTPEYAWLTANAYRYGFVLSYPKNNAYYQFEPWHWRFVGVALATKLHAEKKYFYDLDQREIDTYRIGIFD
jgi:LAS superfamily LD-carboxypeptidase LdcB